MRRLGGACLAALILAAPAAGQDAWSAPPPPWEGTWRGSIGDLPVHACLNNTPYIENGAYYYDRIKTLIRLERDAARGEWIEGTSDKPGARWRIALAAGGSITGTWTGGGKTLPVRLARIGGASQDFDGPCASMAFHRPRLSPVRLVSAPGITDGARFTRLTFKPGPPFAEVEVSSFALDRPGAGVAKVNRLLREILPKADGSGTWFDCMRSNANAHGADGDYRESIEPTLIGARWLAARQTVEDYCGGNHPNNLVRPRTFDLTQGIEVDPLDWLAPAAVEVRRYDGEVEVTKVMTGKFLAMMLKGYQADSPDCEGVLAEREYWKAGIERGALRFVPDLPRVVLACHDEIRVPFARLQPWLNAKGKAAVATLPR